MLDRIAAAPVVESFFESGVPHHTLGLVYGRRRIGKSTLLERLTQERDGFYWEATRGESAVQLARLGAALGAHLGVGSLALEGWDAALAGLLALGREHAAPVVIDEFGYLLEADGAVDSVVAAAFGPSGRRAHPGRARLVLCGSAIALMRTLTTGEAALRGRAGMELVVHPFGYRKMRAHLPPNASHALCTRLHSVIGGVIRYGTDMVDHDLPGRERDFDRWVARRVLSPAATLHHEATLLLAEDPTLSAGSPAIHHSVLGAIATGAVTAGKIANRLRRSVSSLDPTLKRLISTGFVVRHEDPLRARRPTYALGDPFLLFHYAVMEPHRQLLRDRDPATVWKERLSATFDALVRGPVFEDLARTWVRRYASLETLGWPTVYVGPSTLTLEGRELQLDVVATVEGAERAPSDRSVRAIGEAKAGETVGRAHLRRLEEARAALGLRAAYAKVLLFAPDFSSGLRDEAGARADVELVDLERLYEGS